MITLFNLRYSDSNLVSIDSVQLVWLWSSYKVNVVSDDVTNEVDVLASTGETNEARPT
jgi:hypothetical protein